MSKTSTQLFGKTFIQSKLSFSSWSLALVLSILQIISSVVCYISLSPSWCIMCQCDGESLSYPFVHCSFASCFWHFVLEAFGWSLTRSNFIFDILASLMVSHPFGGTE